MSETVPLGLIDSQPIESYCERVRFDPGAVLRQKGQHYGNMFLISDGSATVDRHAARGGAALVAGPGSPIGEIGFLRGCPATATVTAQTAVSALVIDDPTLARLERELPLVTAQILRQLAAIAEDRTSDNLILDSTDGAFTAEQTIEVHLCRNPEMLESAQRLRYEVYCGELHRQSPYADHDKKTIADALDSFGHTFIAIEAGEIIGTLRLNLAAEGPLGVLEELYGMSKSPHHPAATAICTKFIVKKAKRGGQSSLRLIAAVSRYGLRNAIVEGYIDCIPALLPYYKAIGFVGAGPEFLHRENGPSHPMMLDLLKHGERLGRESGIREYLGMIVKAQVFKLLDGVRGARRS